MSIGLGLFKAIISEGKTLSAIADEYGVPESYFSSVEKPVYDFIHKYFTDYGKMPTEGTVVKETGVSLYDIPDEPLQYWVDSLVRRQKAAKVKEAAEKMVVSAGSGNVDEAVSLARHLAVAFDSTDSVDRIRSTRVTFPENKEASIIRQRNTKLSGIPFGMDYLDQLSDGAQGGDTIAIAGRPSTGKTYFILRFALSAYDAGFVPLVVSLEMPVSQCSRRVLALDSGVSSTQLRKGMVSYWGMQKVQKSIDKFKAPDALPFHMMEGSLSTTVENLAFRIRELKPAIVYVDGAYLLRSRERFTSRWERIANTAEYLKMLSKEFQIPIFASYQFNRQGAGDVGNIGGSDVIGQLASIVLSLDKIKTDEQLNWSACSYKHLELIKGREGEQGKIKVKFDMDYMKIEQESVVEGYSSEERTHPEVP